MECGYCERDIRGGHADDCPKHELIKLRERVTQLELGLNREYRHKEVYKVFSHEHLIASIDGVGTIEDVIETRANQLCLTPHRLLVKE